MKTREKIVIEKYAKIERMNTVVTFVAIFLFPLIMLLFFLLDNSGLRVISGILKILKIFLTIISKNVKILV
ncbi:MAG: hypothetical protein ACLKAK_09075 [Alkaliphilus sp.]